MWQQEGSIAAHLVNLNNPMTMRGSYRKAPPAGPHTVDIAILPGAAVTKVRLLEAAREVESRRERGRLIVEVPTITFHEVVAVDLA